MSFNVNSDPATRRIALTGSDQNLDEPAKWIWVGTAGNLNCTLVGEDSPQVIAVQAGANPFAVKSVTGTSTTASGMFACYID